MNFELAPMDVLLGSAEVMRRFAVKSRTTFNRHIKQGRIPAPDVAPMSGPKFWSERRVIEALAKLMMIQHERPEPTQLARARQKRCKP